MKEESIMKKLPEYVSSYKRTQVFDELTVPQGLLASHQTKEGVWGVIHVEKGKLDYIIENHSSFVLSKDVQGVIEPEVLHYIKPRGNVLFFIEFYKMN